MNQHVDRRTLLATSAAATAALAAAATVGSQKPSKVAELEAAFNAEWNQLRALDPEHNAAELRFYAERKKLEGPVMREATDEEIETIRNMTINQIRDGSPLTSASREYADALRRYNKAESRARSKSGFAKAERAYQNQLERVSDAAQGLLHQPAETLADLTAKVRVHRVWEFDGADFDYIMNDIARVAGGTKGVV